MMTSSHSRYNTEIKLTPEEMFEISQTISREFAPDLTSHSPELVLLPVDPYHLYAYWSLGDSKSSALSKADSGQYLILRIYWQPDRNADTCNSKIWFDIAINAPQPRRKVRLPIDGTAYSAILGLLYPDNSFSVIARSNIVNVPRDKMTPPRVQRKENIAIAQIKPQSNRPTYEEVTGAPAAGVNYPEQSLIDAKFEPDLSQKNNQELNPEKTASIKFQTDNPNIHWYDETLFFSRIKDMSYHYGFEQLISPEIKPSTDNNDEIKHASGQGK